jgi:hypothetical protein
MSATGGNPLPSPFAPGARDERPGHPPAGHGPIRVRRGAAHPGRLVDAEREGELAAHEDAHRGGRPSEAVLLYGNGVPADAVTGRLHALAELHAAHGLLRAVHLVPAKGDEQRPGSWGVEDLTAVSAARRALPPEVAVVPSWRLIGPGACQVATAFGADGWWVPADDRNDLALLAAAVGREIEEGTL